VVAPFLTSTIFPLSRLRALIFMAAPRMLALSLPNHSGPARASAMCGLPDEIARDVTIAGDLAGWDASVSAG
jgi:hypothetical protein